MARRLDRIAHFSGRVDGRIRAARQQDVQYRLHGRRFSAREIVNGASRGRHSRGTWKDRVWRRRNPTGGERAAKTDLAFYFGSITVWQRGKDRAPIRAKLSQSRSDR